MVHGYLKELLLGSEREVKVLRRHLLCLPLRLSVLPAGDRGLLSVLVIRLALPQARVWGETCSSCKPSECRGGCEPTDISIAPA